MYILLIIFHMVVCLILISVILLQAGKGGGLTETFSGGDGNQSILGTQAPVILKKATTGAAIAFLVTSLVLGMVTAMRGRSLLQGMRLPATGQSATEEKASPFKSDKVSSDSKTVESKGSEVVPKNNTASGAKPVVK